jgi:hypothetical protein
MHPFIECENIIAISKHLKGALIDPLRKHKKKMAGQEPTRALWNLRRTQTLKGGATIRLKILIQTAATHLELTLRRPSRHLLGPLPRTT